MRKFMTAGLLCAGLIAGQITGCSPATPAGDTSGTTAEAASAGDATGTSAEAATDEAVNLEGSLTVKNGAMQPILEYTDARTSDYTNEDSDILRFCVYVETDYDTDGDGKDDLVKAYVQVPREAAEGGFKAATIYDPTPYEAGTVAENNTTAEKLYVEKEFDYDTLYKEGEKREPVNEMSTLDLAEQASSYEWNYDVPNNDGVVGYGGVENYNYFLVRGFAIVEACGIGTYGSEGYELCGLDLERDSHKAVIEWLTGDRPAFVDKDQNIEIKADWSNGKVAMTGASYGGTLPFEVAGTGVKGLETIIPYAGIASWYDYTNHQGVSIINSVNYVDYLGGFNCGGVYLDDDWTVIDDNYGSYLWQIAQDQEKTNGDYAPIWDSMNYVTNVDKFDCSALIVQGLNDLNVTTKQADLMYRAFKEAGMPVKLMLHQDGHNTLESQMVNGELWNEIVNRWLSHYLYGVDNGAEDMPEVTVQSNVDGSYMTYDSWGDFKYSDLAVSYDKAETTVTTADLAFYAQQYFAERQEGYAEKYEDMEDFYQMMDETNAAVYEIDMPENGTIYGTPEIHVKFKTDKIDYDGLMVTAILMDTTEDGEDFKAYMTKDRLGRTLPVTTVDYYEIGGGAGVYPIREYVQSSTDAKCVSFGWTDLCNPGLGDDAATYTESVDLEADKYYDYTFYMLPTVYTVQEGHSLKLLLMTWDPFRVFLDEDFDIESTEPGKISEYDYSYTVDNAAIKVRMPLAS